MYKNYSKQDFLAHLGLETKYKVDALIVYGTWNIERERKLFTAILADYAQKKSITLQFRSFENFLCNVLEITLDGKIMWFVVAYGGAILSEYVHQACVLGSDCNIVLGTCGGLSKEMKSGDMIFPTVTFGNESITRMYQPFISDNLHKSGKNFTRMMMSKIQKLIEPTQSIYHGRTMTCQAILMQSWKDIVTWAYEEYLCVELETASVFAVSNAFNVRCGACLIVAENLIINDEQNPDSFKNSKETKTRLKSNQYLLAIQSIMEYSESRLDALKTSQ